MTKTSVPRRQAKPSPSTPTVAAKLPGSLETYLAEQQCRARELQDILRLLKDDSDTDNGALVAAWRMARALNVGLDDVSIRAAAKVGPDALS